MNVEELHQSIEATRRAGSSYPVQVAVRTFLVPAYRERGEQEVEPLISSADGDPLVCEALVAFSEATQRPVLDFISERTLIEAAVSAATTRSAQDGWALYALTYARVDPEKRWDLVISLLDLISEDDVEALWLIGDGPVAALQMEPLQDDRLNKYAKGNSKMRRVLDVVADRP